MGNGLAELSMGTEKRGANMNIHAPPKVYPTFCASLASELRRGLIPTGFRITKVCLTTTRAVRVPKMGRAIIDLGQWFDTSCSFDDSFIWPIQLNLTLGFGLHLDTY